MKLPGKGISWRDFFRSLRNEYKFNRLNDAAAALTFFGILSLFPFLLFLVSLASVIIDPVQAQALVDQIAAVAPPQATQIISGQIQNLGQQNSVGLLTIGALGAIWAASKGVLAAMRGLNVVYGVDEGRPGWKVRAISLGMTLLLGALGLAAVLLAVFTPAVAGALPEPFSTIAMWARIPVAALLMMFVWALTYCVLPDVQQKFKLITPGSVVGVIIWAITSWGFSIYVKNFGNYDATYGALGGVIVLLLWMWISSLVLLMGAETNAILEHRAPEARAKGRKELGTPRPAASDQRARELQRRGRIGPPQEA
ncbi:MAG: YihY/virulence factor BrkB family protein [Myxococcaceae bacterium]